MKMRTHLILLLLLVTYAANAQTIYVPGQNIGGSSNANVGIGTGVNPADKLEVAGNVRVSGAGGHWHSQLLFYRSDGTKFATIGQADLDASNSTFDIQHYNGNDIRFLNNGVEQLRIKSNGIVGIGTSSPTGVFGEKLHIYSASNTGIKVDRGGLVTGAFMAYSDQVLVGASSNHQLSFLTNATTRMIVRENGKVGIGMTDPTKIDAMLTVAGDASVREVRVTVNAGADHVFQNEFKLRPLSEVEAFIKAHKHLPEIESADDMKANGLELGEMNIKLLQKIEELTLYMIDFKKDMTKLTEENERLRNEMAELKK